MLERSQRPDLLCFRSRQVRIVLTTPLTQDSPIHEHLRKHGDGVKVAALW
jgi:hypothetical protein